MTRALLLSSVMVCCLGWLSASALAMSRETLYDPLISSTAQHYGLPAALVKAVIRCESAFDPWAQSPRGAQGLMQLIPSTQGLLGVTNAFDPYQNIRGGVRYLAGLHHAFGGDVQLMLAAYNAGPQAVINAGYAIPPFAETQQYVRCVLAAWQRYHQGGTLPSSAGSRPKLPSSRPAAPVLDLKGTALDRHRALALINDQIVTVGQAILGYTVVHIAEGRVELQRQGHKMTLGLVGGR